MNSKIYLFNKTILKSDLKRFWWIAVLYAVALVFLGLGFTNVVDGTPENYYDCLDGGVFALLTGFFTGVILFAYLHKNSSVAFYHSLPVKRYTQYITHYITAVILIGIPTVLFCLFIALYCGNGWGVKYAVKYFYQCLVNGGLAFSIAAFASVIAGNTIAAFVFTGGFYILPFALESGIRSILKLNLYGYYDETEHRLWSNGMDLITNKFYNFDVQTNWGTNSLIRIAVIVILFIIALALYNNRKLENSEEIVVFDILKKAFVAVVSVCVGVFGYMVICATVGKNSILFMLPLGIVAVVVTHMLNNKSISIRGSLKPIAIYTVFVALIYAVFEFNLTGYETRFPNADDVESMSSYTIAQTSYPMDLVWTDGLAADNVPSGEAYDKDFDHTLYTEKNDIERMIEWQKNIVADKDEMLKLKYSTYDSNHNYDDEYWDTVEFVYNLKNGKTLKRIYNIEVSNDKQYVEYRRSEGYKNLYLQYLRDDAIIRSVDLNALVIEKDGKFTFVDDDFDSRPEGAVDKSYVFNDGDIDFDKLLEAIKEDTKSMPEFKSNYNSYIDITYSLPVVVNGRKASLLMSSNLPVSDTYSHTKAFMQQYLH